MNTKLSTSLPAHDRIVLIVALSGLSVTGAFRMLVELGLSPGGSLWVFRVPLEYWYFSWFSMLLALRLSRPSARADAYVNLTALDWLWAVFGLGGTLWLLGTLGVRRFVIGESPVYPFAGVSILAVLLSASIVDRDEMLWPRGKDLRGLLFRRAAWLCVLFAILVPVAGPRAADVPTGGNAFRRWYYRQPIQPLAAAWGTEAVSLVVLTDYQCPACRQAEARYASVVQAAALRLGEGFSFVRVDFPLEEECNPFGRPGLELRLHLAACEAAAAVRLARASGPEVENAVIDWMWHNQARLTPELVFRTMRNEFGLELEESYGQLIDQIKNVTARARELGVVRTPTYFLNGRRLPLLSPSTLHSAIELEAQAAGLGLFTDRPSE